MSRDAVAAGPLRVFIAGEDCDWVCAVADLAEAAGFEIVGTERYSELVSPAVRALKPDVVIASAASDEARWMPLAAAALAANFAPTVLVAPQFAPETVKQGLSLGVYAFLATPLHIDGLRPAIEVARSRWEKDTAAEDRLERVKANEQRDTVIRQAKQILMEARGLTEPEAHRFLQKRSMDLRRTLQGVSIDLITAANALREPSLRPVRSPRNLEEKISQEVAA